MPSAAKVYELTQKAPCFGPARVMAVEQDPHLVQVRLLKAADQGAVWCRPVWSLAGRMVAGDEVLVMGALPDDLYAVDLLAGPSGAQTEKRPQTPPGGSQARAGAAVGIAGQEINPGNGVIKILSGKRELLFEYDPEADKARLFVPAGDLELVTAGGDMTLQAEGKLAFNAQEVEVRVRSGVSLGVSRQSGEAGPSLALDTQRVRIDSPVLGIRVGRGALFFKELKYAGEKICATAGHVQLMARKLETAAKTMLQKAENVYVKVRQLSQLQAGRKRVLVDDTFYVKSKRSVMKADSHFKVKSDKIHLG